MLILLSSNNLWDAIEHIKLINSLSILKLHLKYIHHFLPYVLSGANYISLPLLDFNHMYPPSSFFHWIFEEFCIPFSISNYFIQDFCLQNSPSICNYLFKLASTLFIEIFCPLREKFLAGFPWPLYIF